MSKELFLAIDEHNAEKVTALLQNGASPNSPLGDEPHWKPLEAAIEELQTGGSIEIVKRLIEYGANVNEWDINHSLMPVHCAVFSLNEEATRLLLENGADPNCVSDEGETPLMYAVECDEMNIVKLLIQHGANKTVNHFGGSCGISALTFSVKNLNIPMTEILLKAGADPDALDADDQSARAYLPERNQQNLQQWTTTAELL